VPDGPSKEQRVDIIGNSGLHKSPSELLEPEQFRHFLADLRAHYDYIFMESAALNQYSDAQELAPFADRVVAVFNAGSAIQGADKASLEYLKGLGDQFAGSILTGVDARNV
jgi:polysaccharide biosynthesis transport protein